MRVMFNAWPYWRELGQASLTRMFMPLHAVPVFRLPRNRTDDGAKQDEGRERRKGREPAENLEAAVEEAVQIRKDN